MGSHSFKAGGDYRILGVRSSSFGASTGSFTFDGRFTGNAMADLLLGYLGSGNIPISADLDGYINYSAGFLQDDWRVNDRLTVNYGVRVEHETNLRERNDQITTDFAMDTLSPLNIVNVPSADRSAARLAVSCMRARTARGQQGGTRGRSITGWVRSQPERKDGSARRLGHLRALELRRGRDDWSQYGLGTTEVSDHRRCRLPRWRSVSRPLPPAERRLGMLTNVGASTNVRLPARAPKVQL